MWHVSSRSVPCELLYTCYLVTYLLSADDADKPVHGLQSVFGVREKRSVRRKL